MRLVITGASGFVASNIIPYLLSKDIPLLLVGRTPSNLSQKYSSCQICDYSQLEEMIQKEDKLLHLAILNNDQEGKKSDFEKVNIHLLEDMITICQKKGISHILYTASTHAKSAKDDYGESKYKAQQILNDLSDITVTQFILPAVYGDNSYKGKLAILNYVPAPLRPVFIKILSQIKPVIHASRVASAVASYFNEQNKLNSEYIILK